MNEKLLIYNGFGIAPTKSYAAAGFDFYIPVITKETENIAFEALKKSYKKSNTELNTILNRLEKEITIAGYEKQFNEHKMNILHLLLAVDGSIMRTSQNKVDTFIHYYLEFNQDGMPGVRLHCNDHILINSGVKVALDHDTAGIFFNKSGRGNNGFDQRACVVDEDYAGYVHLSAAYTKDNVQNGCIFCGDKLQQMVILPIIHKTAAQELTEDEYDKKMKDSERGADAFGSTDKKK